MPEQIIIPILAVVAGINVMLSLAILSRGLRQATHVIFGLIALSAGLWGGAIIAFYTESPFYLGVSWVVVTHSVALIIAYLFFCFSIMFPAPIYERTRLVVFLTLLPLLWMIYLLADTQLVLGDTHGFAYELYGGYFAYGALLVLYFFAGYAFLFRQLFEADTPETKQQIRYVLIGAIVSSSLALIPDLILPKLGIYGLTWLGPIFTAILVGSVFMAILRYGLFDIKLIATEIFVGLLTLVFGVNIVIAQGTGERITNTIIFIATLFFGFLLIRSVNKEIAAREEIRALAKRLTDTNWELARTNEQLRIIDQRKSEFVSIVSHQLRTPITAIKGYASMILEESYGKVPTELRAPLDKIFTSSNRLATMVAEFLDISKIEQGTMTYTFTSVDIRAITTDLVGELLVAAGKKGLLLKFSPPKDGAYVVRADEGKIRQILSNLIDNAIKYTLKGEVAVRLEEDASGKVVRIHISDTGIGLSQDDIHHLFGKFTRGSQGQKQNTDGSGLGLYVAKKMLEAMGGRIWADSEGQGKGSTFVIELPLADKTAS